MRQRQFKFTTALRNPAARVLSACAVLCCVTAAGAAVAGGQAGADLLKVRLGGDNHQTRVVIELDKTATGDLVSPAEASKHVVLALPHVQTAGNMSGQG